MARPAAVLGQEGTLAVEPLTDRPGLLDGRLLVAQQRPAAVARVDVDLDAAQEAAAARAEVHGEGAEARDAAQGEVLVQVDVRALGVELAAGQEEGERGQVHARRGGGVWFAGRGAEEVG